MSADDRRERRNNEERPNDWLFETLSRMEATQIRHANEARAAIAELTRKIEEHIKDDHTVQSAMQTALQALENASEFEKETKLGRQAWLIALSSVAGGAMLKAIDALFARHP